MEFSFGDQKEFQVIVLINWAKVSNFSDCFIITKGCGILKCNQLSSTFIFKLFQNFDQGEYILCIVFSLPGKKKV